MRSIALYAGCAVIGLMTASGVASAQDAPAPPSKDDAADDRYHQKPGRDIVVTGILPTERKDMLSGVAILQGAELTQKLRPSIGETLSRTAGVSATSFGPNASRPVLRGLQGERVRVLSDGIGSIDVSNTSADHATVVNPLLADRIEVLRGPQSLLYGSSAIGGVVNVLDKRIPLSVPEEPVHVGAIGTYGSAANERSIAGSIDVPLSGEWVVHADGSYSRTGNMRIGGYALTPQKRAEALASSLLSEEDDHDEDHDHDHEEDDHDHGGEVDFAANAAVRGKLSNSASETWTAGTGIAYIGSGGSLGLSYGHYDSLYGVPIRYATRPGQEQEAPRLSLVQNRFDARGQIYTDGDVLQSVQMRLAYASYRHFELGEGNDIHTAFYNKGMEGRLELKQAKHGAWSGATGAQFFTRDFNVVGEEAFLPKNSTEQWGLFTLQQLDYGALKIEAGARFEKTTVSAKPGPDQPQFIASSRSFNAISGSAGASYALASNWRVGFNLSRTQRAPASDELFANGPHAGTESFEIGNPDFKKESAWSAEAMLRGSGPGYTFEASVYHSWFSDFIYSDLTGEFEDGLPVYQFAQADARYYGFEVQGSLTLAQVGDFRVVADGLADYTRARIVGVSAAPRIPPLRLLGGVGVTSPKIDVRGEVEWVDAQKRISNFETPTSGYKMVNAEVNLRPWGNDRPLSFALSANNIFDVNARRHASFLKDFAPLSGRDLRVTARVDF